MSGRFHDLDDARAEINDPVWRLLGRAPLPEPDAWFAARTLARCRALRRRGLILWRWALGGGLAVIVAVFAVTRVQDEQVTTDTQQKNVQEAFDIVASIGTDDDGSTAASNPTWPDSL